MRSDDVLFVCVCVKGLAGECVSIDDELYNVVFLMRIQRLLVNSLRISSVIFVLRAFLVASKLERHHTHAWC